MESQDRTKNGNNAGAIPEEYRKVIEILRNVRPDTLTAREALNLIYDLTEEVSYI